MFNAGIPQGVGMKVVGVDPGKETGVALVSDGVLEFIDTVDFWTVYLMLGSSFNPQDTRVVVEVPYNNKNWHGNGAAVAVGGVIRESRLLADGIELLGFDVTRVHPTGRGKKMKHKEFCELTGWRGRTNKHTRDAALLALGVR